jgi:hypothetical protein
MRAFWWSIGGELENCSGREVTIRICRRPAAILRGVFIFGKKKEKRFSAEEENRRRRARREEREEESTGKGEDEEIAFAGNDDGEGAAVGRDGEIAEAEAVKDGDWRGLGDGDFVIRGDRR